MNTAHEAEIERLEGLLNEVRRSISDALNLMRSGDLPAAENALAWAYAGSDPSRKES